MLAQPPSSRADVTVTITGLEEFWVRAENAVHNIERTGKFKRNPQKQALKCLRNNENVQEGNDSTFKGKQVAKACQFCLKLMVEVKQGVGRCKYGTVK